MTSKNTFGAPVIAFVTTLTAAIMIILTPLFFGFWKIESGGIGAVAGGFSEWLSVGLPLLLAVIFVAVFLALRRPRLRNGKR